MDHFFWQHLWQTQQIGFHQSQVHRYLIQHLHQLRLTAGARIFVPLCGKTLDIGWLLQQGYDVVAIELSPLAVEALLLQLGLTAHPQQLAHLWVYHTEHLDIFVGDIFNLTQAILGPVDAIYDRAALVALPLAMRQHYAQQLAHLTNQAPQLLIVYDYWQAAYDGPPFSISDSALKQLYQVYYATYTLVDEQVSQDAFSLQLNPSSSVLEKLWLLQ